MELTLLYSHNLPITHGTQSGFQTDVVHLFNIYRFKHPFAKPRPLHFLPAKVAEEKKMVFIGLDMAKIVSRGSDGTGNGIR